MRKHLHINFLFCVCSRGGREICLAFHNIVLYILSCRICSILNIFYISLNYVFFQWCMSICFSPSELQASGYHDPPSEYTICFPYGLTNDFRNNLATSILLCYALKCEHQGFYNELVRLQPKAMHHQYRLSESIFHL